MPEVPSGDPSPPQSPPLAAYAIENERHSPVPGKNVEAGRGGAAYTITEKCERLFCETLKTIFLGEGNLALQDSLVMDMQEYGTYTSNKMGHHGSVTDWLEIWDYVGGATFRGFITENEGERDMFIFFNKNVLGSDLKPGLMALLELCSVSEFDCSRLVVCLDRRSDSEDMKGLMRDLGWVGFEAMTLAEWTNSPKIVSDRWVMLGMDS